MKRGARGASWVLFAVTIYLLFAAATRHWLGLPEIGDRGFVRVFVLFSLTHCAVLEGAKRTAIFFGISAVVSYCLEEVGVRTGAVYGSYHYSAMLGGKLGHVPVIIPLAWFMMIYPCWMVARTLLDGTRLHTLGGRTAVAVMGAWVITAWDMVMDPGMATSGNWVWERGGAYFGVPRHNYLGWLGTTFLVYWLAGWLWREPVVPRSGERLYGERLYEALPLLVYAMLAVRYVFYTEIPAMQLIALFTMGMPALTCVLRVLLKWREF